MTKLIDDFQTTVLGQEAGMQYGMLKRALTQKVQEHNQAHPESALEIKDVYENSDKFVSLHSQQRGRDAIVSLELNGSSLSARIDYESPSDMGSSHRVITLGDAVEINELLLDHLFPEGEINKELINAGPVPSPA